jgi:riboflavin biosynthesis pyrimidine reductase
MRALIPKPIDAVDLLAVYREDLTRTPHDRPYLRLNMVSSLDGGTSLAGRSGGLGGSADRRLFFVLRSIADVVLVGAGTARAESYGPVRLEESLRAARRERGQEPLPQLAVVTRACDLDFGSALFAEGERRPMIVTSSGAPGEVVRRAAEVAEVIVAGDEAVDLVAALAALRRRGVKSVICEGGPTLNGYLVGAGAVDELCLTLSPRLVGADGAKVVSSVTLPWPLEVELAQLLEEDGFLFMRLGLGPNGAGGPPPAGTAPRS